jgi:hypothetical protein
MNLIRVTAVAAILVAVASGAGCGGSSAPSSTTSAAESKLKDPGDVGTPEPAVDIDPSLLALTASAQRFTYASRSGVDDGVANVTGIVFVPKGQVPDGGWQLVALGHPASGTLPGCAPSLSPTLLNLAPIVAQLLQAGHAVVMSDYQGLAKFDKSTDTNKRDSYHPYLDSTTVGYNLIDSVRAARTLVGASDKWFALGIGQGGQAAWAADELVDNQGQYLILLGAVAISPVSDINGLAAASEASTLNVQQKLDLVGFLAALKNAYGGDFTLDDYRSGLAKEKWDALLACQGQALSDRSTIAAGIGADDLRPRTAAAAAALLGYLQKTSLPLGPTQAPMLVVYSGNDQLSPPDWTELALDRACKMGDVIQIQRLPDDAPDQVDLAAALDWMSQRVNSVPAQNDCEGRTP